MSIIPVFGVAVFGQNHSDRDRVLLTVDESGSADCFFPSSGHAQRQSKLAGILLWKNEQGFEQWRFVQAGEVWPRLGEAWASTSSSRDGSRGIGTSATASLGSLALPATLRLEALASSVLTRGSVLISPQANARILSPFPILRRSDPQGELTAAKVQIYQGNKKSIEFSFAAGQSSLDLHQIDEFKKSHSSGLNPGNYSLKLQEPGRVMETQFSVASMEERTAIEKPLAEFSTLVEPDEESARRLSIYHKIEYLLAQVEEGGRPLYLGDALDAIETYPAWESDDVLKLKHREISDWLAKLARDPNYSGGRLETSESSHDNKIADAFDAVRALIASGQWTTAREELEKLPTASGTSDEIHRTALRSGYLAVVYAESGPLLATEAMKAFDQAIEALSRLKSEKAKIDLSRMRNNYANYHLLLAQNHLHNHSFQLAAGTPQPLLATAYHLSEAKKLLLRSLNGFPLDQASRESSKVNLARVYLSIADLTSTLAMTEQEIQQKKGLEESMLQGAKDLLKSIVDEPRSNEKPPSDPLQKSNRIHASALELLSQIAYRNRDWKGSETYAAGSLEHDLNLGFLSGLESNYRLLALIRDAQSLRSEAIRNMRISQHFAEVNRARFPADRTGQSRAGFFARQAVIYEKLAEWSLLAGDPAFALVYVEQAKTRAAQDLLGLHRTSEETGSEPPRDIDSILQNLPSDTSIVEYFLTAERGWGFLIQRGRPVRSFPLKASDGSILRSQQLLARVRRLLNDFEGQAPKIKQRWTSGEGMDNSWQDELHEMRLTLLPDEILAEVRKTTSLVLIPQHILHYLPFSALVISKDRSKLEKNAIAKPRFLVDEGFRLINAPSLTIWDVIRNRRHAPFRTANAIGLATAPGLPSLPGVEKDLINMREVFGKDLRGVIENDQATKEAAVALLREAGILMLATHGFNDADRPLESYLVFFKPSSTGPGEKHADASAEGRLTAREILSHQVNARLIVLSACYSGLGDRSPQPGDDLFGLQRAFLQSGGRCVVSGLWDVYDGCAPDLIMRFYQELKKTSSPSLALPKAQRSFLNRLRASKELEPWLHPYFWSVFSLCGAD